MPEQKKHEWLDRFYRPLTLSILTAILLGGGGFAINFVSEMNVRIGYLESRSFTTPENRMEVEQNIPVLKAARSLKDGVILTDSLYVLVSDFKKHEIESVLKNYANSNEIRKLKEEDSEFKRIVNLMFQKLDNMDSKLDKMK